MPYEGLKPVVPVYAAGSRTDPPVSVPNALFLSVKISEVLKSKLTHHIVRWQQLQRYHRSFHQPTESLRFEYKCSGQHHGSNA